MKKLLIALLAISVCVCGAVAAAYAEVDSPVGITTAEEFYAMERDGNYVLENDIVLGKGKQAPAFRGTFDGNGHTITVNDAPAAFGPIGYYNDKDESQTARATIKNLVIAGTVKGTARVAGVSSSAVGTIENVKVTADISSTANQGIAGIASCSGKGPLLVKDCVFEGTITLTQGFTAANNYSYWGMFLGYNGGAFGGGKVENGIARYTFAIPTSDDADIENIEYFNTNGDATGSKENSYTKKTVGESTVYTFDCVVNMDPVTIASVNDEGIMANYGTPVVRFTLKDGSYRYIDGYDRANGRYITSFDNSEKGFAGMYKYKDISYLTIKTTSSVTEDGELDGQTGSVTSIYSEVTVNNAEEFESFARIINSAIPASFKDTDGNTVTRSILDTLTISVKLNGDIDLTAGDENGNKSEFYGLGKQEFFPYRAGIDGNGHTITVDIDAPNGYCVGLISVVSEMSEKIYVKDLTVKGSIKGRTKAGIVGYFDMVCNNYVNGGTLYFNNVKNEADVTGYTAVGGLLGCVSTTTDAVKTFIDSSENKGNITLLDNGKYAGGLVGVAGFYLKNGVRITDSSNSGNIIIGASAKYAGGIAGALTDNLSVLTNVSSSAEVAASAENRTGKLIGETGAVKMAAVSGDIGRYNVTAPDKVYAVTFVKDELTSSYGTVTTIALNDGEVTPNYDLRLTFTDTDGERYAFADGKTERSKNAQGNYTVRIDPGIYTLGIVAYYNDDYYNDGSLEEGKALAATATYTVTKKNFNFNFTDVSAAFTGEPITYFDALEKTPGYDNANHAIPDTSAAEGAKWEVKYYKDGEKVSAPTEPGEYDVTVRLDATEKFASRYNYNADTFSVTMTVTGAKLTVTVNNLEISKGDSAAFTVSVKTSDGSTFTDIDSLGLRYKIKNFGAVDTSALGFGTYTVEAEGQTSVGGYTVEYKSGTLVVKNVAATSDSSSKAPNVKRGCKGDLGAVCSFGIAALAAAVALKRKED